MRRARLSRRNRVSASIRSSEFMSSSERSGSNTRSSRRARPTSRLKPSRYSPRVASSVRCGVAAAGASPMTVSDMKPARKIPAVQQAEKGPRQARSRWQRALVGEARKPGPQRADRLGPLAVQEKVPAPEEHPGTRVEPQAPRPAARGEPDRRAGPARPGKHDAWFGLGQVSAEKARRLQRVPADFSSRGGDL